MGTDSVELKPFTRISSFWPVKFKAVVGPPRPMSGYSRNRTLQEQWSRLCVNLFPIEAQEGVPLVSCKTANRLRSMTKFAAYSGSAGGTV